MFSLRNKKKGILELSSIPLLSGAHDNTNILTYVKLAEVFRELLHIMMDGWMDGWMDG